MVVISDRLHASGSNLYLTKVGASDGLHGNGSNLYLTKVGALVCLDQLL